MRDAQVLQQVVAVGSDCVAQMHSRAHQQRRLQAPPTAVQRISTHCAPLPAPRQCCQLPVQRVPAHLHARAGGQRRQPPQHVLQAHAQFVRVHDRVAAVQKAC